MKYHIITHTARRFFRFALLLAIGIGFTQKASAQLIIDNSMTPEQLVQNVLIGSGVSAFNVVYTGNVNNAICSFSNGGTTNLGIQEGIILSSGVAAEAANPASFHASTNNFTAGDPDLDMLPGVLGTNDASILEFDFIPQSDSLTFRYVFGSEEYPTFVNQFNDVFAFFISGPNPSGGNYINENIALVPGTTLPVSINNVNNGNTNTGPCVNCEYYINNEDGSTICYDGFTTVLEATAILTACSTYHMKLTIADDLDEVYDSGVFLEANSFSATGLQISSNFSSSSPGYGALIEGCNDATIYFELINPLLTDYPIYFEYMGTAVNGVDYILLPDSLIIPPGSLIDSINLIPIQNNAIDPTRTLIIAFDYESACSTEEDTLELLILDNTIELSGLDTLYCSSDPTQTLTLYPPTGVLTGPGATGTTFNPAIANMGMNIIQYTNYFIDYSLLPNDTVCINQAVDTTWVQRSVLADAGSDESVCQGDPFDFNNSFNLPQATDYDSLVWTTTGIGTFNDSKILRPIYFPDPFELGDLTFTLTAYGIEPCPDITSSMSLVIDTLPVTSIMANPFDSICIGEPVQFSNASNCQLVSWQWNLGDGNTANTSVVNHTYANPGTYTISLISTNAYNCSDTSYYTKTVTDPSIDFYTTPNPSCLGDTVWFHGTGDAVTYADWQWDFGDGNGDEGRDVWWIYTSPGVKNVTLDVCTEQVQHNHFVVPPATADAGSNEFICEYFSFDFGSAVIPASANNIDSLRWFGGLGTFNDQQIIHPVYTPAPGELGLINFMLVAYAIQPCSNDTSYMNLTVFDGRFHLR